MPWKETCAMDQKIQMIGDYKSGDYTISELARVYEVSRKTIYKWVGRYEMTGPSGLEELPRAPKRHANATPQEVAIEIVATKLRYRNWGPKKIVAYLEERRSEKQWPAVSTAGDILKREGLVRSRKRKHKTPSYTEPFNKCNRANAVWSADFKGQFRTGDGNLCYPLTISDNYSRYLLLCQGLSHPSYEEVKPWFERVFKEYGLPEAIRTDNGAPFASVALGGLSCLAVWFIKLGIKPERIETGHPEQNGRHERMHRSLKEATAKPPRKNLEEQQKAFGEFAQEYNDERPHEAVDMKTPASRYRRSLRRYPASIPELEYKGDFVVRRVRHNGEIRWNGELVYISESLAGEPVALKQRAEHVWEIRYSYLTLGVLDELTGKIIPLPSKQGEKVLTMCSV